MFSSALEMARKNTSVPILMHDPGTRRLQIADVSAGRAARLQGHEQALRDRQLGRPALQNVERVGATTMSLMQIVGGSFQQ